MKHFYFLIVISQFVPVLFASVDPRGRSGWQRLGKKRYNEVAYAATNNGHSFKESDVACQDISLKEQFALGIRATKLHVWYDTDSAGNVVPFVCQGIDKKLLYDPPLEQVLEKVPFVFRSCARTFLEKAAPFKKIALDAFNYAYGTDNSTGAIPFKHCILDPAAQPLQQALTEVQTFLLNNPHEIMTLIIENHTGHLKEIAGDFKKAGLEPYVHQQHADKPWPMLEQMVASGKRLVVFVYASADLDYKKFPWMHSLWDYAWDTKSQFKEINQFKDTAYDIVPHEGKQAFAKRHETTNNKIFVVNHFISGLVGGSKANALKANRKSIVRARLKRLHKETGHLPTLVFVDFFEYPSGDFLSVINELNGV